VSDVNNALGYLGENATPDKMKEILSILNLDDKEEIRCQFHQYFMSSFYVCRSKKRKNTDALRQFHQHLMRGFF
jgi:hypothetical protein